MRGRLRSAAFLLSAFCASPALAQQTFEEFRNSFRIDAVAAGVSAETYDREMASARALPIVNERNDNQPEFSRAIWQYLDSAVSERRVADGRTKLAAHIDLLHTVEASYGVDAPVIAAIWGLESAYGEILGDLDVISSLSTLAYQGRRQRYGREQLIGALKILDNGYADRTQLKGSWAGAMGQTQFIPTTYLSYAVDMNADGKRDLWADHEDVFASTANYLATFGWEKNKPWGFEVMLPADFDFSQTGLQSKKSVAQWDSLGITAAEGRLADRADLNTTASILVPAGASGPAFIVFQNFRTIMRYNNSTAYALGIGMLSDALAGNPVSLAQEWPRDDRALSLTERKNLQQALADRGYDPGPVDGIIGAGTQRALRAWQRDNGRPADGYASAAVLSAILAS